MESVVDALDFVHDANARIAEYRVTSEIMLTMILLLTQNSLCFGLNTCCWRELASVVAIASLTLQA
jgi:hypothetical protein